MSNLKLLRTILRLESLQITHFRFMHRDTELHLAVKPYKNGCRCPACGRRGRIVRQTTELRRWEDVAVMGLRVVLWYAPKEIQCPTHGRMQEEIPGAPVYARVTYRLEWRLCALCQIMTQKAAAEILGLPTSTLSNLLHRVITRVRHGHTIRGLTTLGVDEISYCKGRKFATLVYDLDRARVLWVGPGKGRDNHRSLLQRLVEPGADSAGRLGQLRHEPGLYRGNHAPLPPCDARPRPLPSRQSAEPGRGRGPQVDTQGRKAIKGLRWLLSRHSRHRTKGHTRFLNSLRNSNRRIHRAWVLKDEFEHFWDYRYPASAKTFLRRWMTAALRSRLPTMRTFVGTLRTHLVHIMAFIDRPLTNAVGEGLNRMVKIVKNRASGYRHLDYFADMIYLTVGDLDIPAQIPSQLRTL